MPSSSKQEKVILAEVEGAEPVVQEEPVEIRPSVIVADESFKNKKASRDPVAEERKLRQNLSRYLIVTAVSLCFYTFVLDHIQRIRMFLSSTTFITMGLLVVFMTGIVFLILASGYPLYEYGLTLKNWKRAVKEGILFTLPILAGMLLLKWIAITVIPAYHGIPLFDLHAGLNYGVQHISNQHTVWWVTLILYGLILAPLQEILARGGLQGALSLFLTVKHRNIIAALVASMIFSTAHLTFPIHVVMLSFFGGLFWGWLFYRHKSIVGASISHAMLGLWFFWFLGIS